MKFKVCAMLISLLSVGVLSSCSIKVGHPSVQIIDNNSSLSTVTETVDISTGAEVDEAGTSVYSPDSWALSPYVEINGNKPFFKESNYTTDEFEIYSPLDELGRCGVAYANISPYTLPDEDRGAIGNIKPSGWQSTKYDGVPGKYLYNRCHLIGYQLAAENDNALNLITGTRYLNINGMLEHENLVAKYVRETGNHVLYRVTPIYDGDNLVANGVLMEAYSVEDNGEGVQFNIFAYNVQPQVHINYADGTSYWITDGLEYSDETVVQEVEQIYYLNESTHKYHKEDCKYITDDMIVYCGEKEWIEKQGYEPCKVCKP